MSLSRVVTELKKLTHDRSNNGVSVVVGQIIRSLKKKRGGLVVPELKNRTIILPNNAAMRGLSSALNEPQLRVLVFPPPLAQESDKNEVENLTRTWSLPIPLRSLGSIAVIVPVVLKAKAPAVKGGRRRSKRRNERNERRRRRSRRRNERRRSRR